MFTIAVVTREADHKASRYCAGEHLSDGYGEPDAVDAEDERQNDNRSCFEHECAQKRDERRNKPIVECGEQGLCVYRKAHEQEAERIYLVSIYGKVEQRGVVGHEDLRYRLGECLSSEEHEQRGNGDES